MTIVVDASVVVSSLIDTGPEGRWAEQALLADDLAAPFFMPVEAANILRIAALSGDISHESASLAHADLLALPVELFPYHPLGGRVWELHRTVTAYDAWYVALAEALDAALVTLDRRLTRASGPNCRFLTFGS